MYIHDQFDDKVVNEAKCQFVLKGSHEYSFLGRRKKKVANETTTTTVETSCCRGSYFHVVFDNVIVVVL